MLPPSSTEISSGPRRAVKVALWPADLPPLLSQMTASARTRMSAPMRQRGCFLMSARILFEFGIGHLLPLAVVLDGQDSQIVPELQPGDGMADQGLGALVLRTDQIVLRVHLVLRLGPAQFCQQVLLFYPAFGDFHADFADFIISLGLIEGAPAVAHLQFDFVRAQFERAAGPFQPAERPAIGGPLGQAFQLQNEVPSP